MAEERADRFAALEERYSGYEVYDNADEKVGKVDDLFVDEYDNPEYLGIQMGLFGLSGTTLIPWQMVRVDEQRRRIEVVDSKDHIKNAPNFDDHQEITPEFEEQIYSHFGLERAGFVGEERIRYGDYYGGVWIDEDELRVQRSEEELRAGTREREAGDVNVRKRVRTDREQVRVPKRREEVHVERVPVEGREEASEVEIGEEEVSVPVTEEEVVAEKHPVVKEEVRIRKEVIEDEELVEEDVRKEEVEVDNETRTRRREK